MELGRLNHIRIATRSKPLPFRGGVGVGAVGHTQCQPDSPHPTTPSPEGEWEQ